MNLSKWEKRFVQEAKAKAEWSKDPNTKIGCVLVIEERKQIISSGYNGIPEGVNDDIPLRHSRVGGEKYYWYEHAERNAIYKAASYGIKTRGSTAFLSFGMPCTDCARALIQAGIVKVVYKSGHPTGEPNEKWTEAAKRSEIMFVEAGIELIPY